MTRKKKPVAFSRAKVAGTGAVSLKCPEIAVFVDLAVEPARGVLRGFMRYIRLNSPWNVNFISKTASDVDPTSLNNWSGDGILAHIPDESTFREILSKNCPIVLLARENEHAAWVDENDVQDKSRKGTSRLERLAREVAGKKGAPAPVFIKCDNDSIGKMAADYFIGHGFGNFAYVSYPKAVPWCRERFESFQTTLASHGYEVHVFPPSNDAADWFTQRDELRAWLESLPKPIGVMAANDFRGRQILEVCQRAGIPVPYQVAVLGVDNDLPVCEMSYPSLSSIAIDWERAGYLSAESLDRLMQGRRTNEASYGPISVVSRGSTERYQLSDLLVVHILELIRLNRGENLRVVDILRSLPVSARSAQERFKKVMGHSIMEEIKRVRMKNIREVVEQTDLPFRDIAASFGFENANHLGRLFKQEFGMTMSEYRSRNGSQS